MTTSAAATARDSMLNQLRRRIREHASIWKKYGGNLGSGGAAATGRFGGAADHSQLARSMSLCRLVGDGRADKFSMHSQLARSMSLCRLVGDGRADKFSMHFQLARSMSLCRLVGDGRADKFSMHFQVARSMSLCKRWHKATKAQFLLRTEKLNL